MLKPELARIIDEIERIRAKNNTLHCDLIRVLYEVAPEKARAIFRQIEANDAEIVRLGKRSAEL